MHLACWVLMHALLRASWFLACNMRIASIRLEAYGTGFRAQLTVSLAAHADSLCLCFSLT